MKINIRIFALFCLFAFTLNAQNVIKGSGKTITKTRSVTPFDQVSVSGSFHVKLVKGNENLVEITAEDNMIEHITTKVKDGKLKIEFENNFRYRSHKTIHIVVNFNQLKEVKLSGSGEIVSTELINAETFEVALSGSGNIDIEVSANEITSRISGSGNIKLAGNTPIFNGSISGSGNLNSQELATNIVNAKISGSGNIKVAVEDEIHAKTSGSGNIIYSGNPSIIKANSSGSGAIKQKH